MTDLGKAVTEYFRLWDRCGGSTAVAAEEFAAARQAMRDALAQPQSSREAIIEECASFIQSGAGMADLIDQDDLDEQARLLRGIADTRPLCEGKK